MKNALALALKSLAVWIVLLAVAVAASLAVPIPAQPAGDGPLSAGQALLAVNFLTALALAALSPRLRGSLTQRAFVLFALLYGAGTVLAHVEALFFGSALAIPDGLLEAVAATDAVRCAAGSLAAASLWRGPEGKAAAPTGLPWKLPAVSLLYVVAYFAAGFVIAWQSAAVRAFYGDGFSFDLGDLVLLQLVRGAAWAGLALLAVRALAGPPAAVGTRLGTAFSVFMAAPLLYPTALMPWSVRQVHLLEVGLSNFLFGLAAAAILLAATRGSPAAGRNPGAVWGSMP